MVHPSLITPFSKRVGEPAGSDLDRAGKSGVRVVGTRAQAAPLA